MIVFFNSTFTAILIAGAVLAGLFLAFLLIRGILRRRYFSKDADNHPAFSISQIENMYEKGHISKEEFEILRNSLMNDISGREN